MGTSTVVAETNPLLGATSLTMLVRICRDLGFLRRGLSSQERRILSRAEQHPKWATSDLLDRVRGIIAGGGDPLGDALARLRSREALRKLGSFYTGRDMVQVMLDMALLERVGRVVDAGCGSGRFSVESFRRRPNVHLVAIDTDPYATIITRTNLYAAGCRSADVRNENYLTAEIPRVAGTTAYVGNPPYVRFQLLSKKTQRTGDDLAERLGHSISGQASLHAYFFLATRLHGKPGDIGCFVTSAEWLDTTYGVLVKRLFLDGLGGKEIHVFDTSSAPFPDISTTAAITYFELGSNPTEFAINTIRSAADIRRPTNSRTYRTDAAVAEAKWSNTTAAPEDGPTFGSLFRVKRGTATGCNRFFIMTSAEARRRGLSDFCVPVISRARHIKNSGGRLRCEHLDRVLLVLPGGFDRKAHPAVHRYLCSGERKSGGLRVRDARLCVDRKVWYSLAVEQPPIVVTYMARHSPVFALNDRRYALLNVAHGLWPKKRMNAATLERVVAALNAAYAEFEGIGRKYHGGLQKWEPGDMMQIPLPEDLRDLVAVQAQKRK